jgi:hypothetical protein
MAATMIGTASGTTVASWGTAGVTSDLGIVVSARKSDNSEVYNLKDATGDVIAHIFYDAKQEVELEIMAKDASVNPEAGDAITIAGVAAVVLSAETRWQSEDMKKISVTAVKHSGVTLGS